MHTINAGRLFMTMILSVLTMAACSEKEAIQPDSKAEKIEIVKLEGKTVIQAEVAMVGESLLDVKLPHKSYKQEESEAFKTFVKAIEKAEKMPGVVDVAVPDYLLTLTFDDKTKAKYSLWLGMDGGSIMDEKNTHTISSLPSYLIDDLNKYVK